MKITKHVDFCAAHSIKEAGICARKHGHNWHAVIEVESVGGNLTDARGFLVDVKDLKASAMKYDHDDLDKFFEYASTENVAQQIAEDALQAVIKCNPELNVFVRVHLDETKNNSADAVATNVEYKKLNRTYITPVSKPQYSDNQCDLATKNSIATSLRFVGLKGAAQDYETEVVDGDAIKPELEEKFKDGQESTIQFGGAQFQNKGH